MTDTNDTEDLERAIASAGRNLDSITHYECRTCGRLFESGRKGRQHAQDDHDETLPLKTVRAGEDK